MMKFVAAAILLAALSVSALAQGPPDNASIVAACGTPNKAYPAGSVQPLTENTDGLLCNGAVVVPSSGAAASVAPLIAGSASSSIVVCSAACNLYDAYVTAGATPGWLLVFNAVAAPSNGATTAGVASGNLQDCIAVPANTTQSLFTGGAPPERFTTGATLTFSSTACATLTLSATAFLHGRGK